MRDASPALEKDARFAGLYKTILANEQTSDRIPYISFIGNDVYNFWTDSLHLRGVWRKTTLSSYQSKSPAWSTGLDFYALSEGEGQLGVARCAVRAAGRARDACSRSLSDGGEDAVTIREFDLSTRTFVRGGFVLPKGKQGERGCTPIRCSSRANGNSGELTTSGYPYIVRRVVRGQPLASAVEVYRATKATCVWPTCCRMAKDDNSR